MSKFITGILHDSLGRPHRIAMVSDTGIIDLDAHSYVPLKWEEFSASDKKKINERNDEIWQRQ